MRYAYGAIAFFGVVALVFVSLIAVCTENLIRVDDVMESLKLAE
jgi:hypothetical protein